MSRHGKFDTSPVMDHLFAPGPGVGSWMFISEVGEFYALDARTGDELFVYQHNRPIRASPLTYQVDGKQYMSVVSTNEVLTFSLP